MDRDPDLLTMLLLDPCLTTDEASREAAARAGRSEPPRTAEPREMQAKRRFLPAVSASPRAAA